MKNKIEKEQTTTIQVSMKVYDKLLRYKRLLDVRKKGFTEVIRVMIKTIEQLKLAQELKEQSK